MTNNLVTICVATYNRSKHLRYCIKSIQNQEYNNIEIIVVDDCSTDNTKEVVSEFMKNDNRIKYIKHENNKGLAAARNTAIFNANGKYFTFIDDDDRWTTNFIKEFVTLAEKYNKNYAFCCGNKIFNNNKEINLIPSYEGELINYIKKGYTPPVAAQFYFTEELKEIGGYNEDIKSGVDHDLWLSLAFKGYKIKCLEKALAIPNTNNNMDRMTTNYEKRNREINNSLCIWKSKIINNCSKEFYEYFKNAYNFYTTKKFFLVSLKNLQFKDSIKFFFENKNKLKLIKFLINSINKKIINNIIPSKKNKNQNLYIKTKPAFLPFED